jgi:hypothetical protein
MKTALCIWTLSTLASSAFCHGSSQDAAGALLDTYNVTWESQSRDSSESMPVGGGDIGLNVWVEDNELLFYIARSGTFDENNEFLKLGRIRLTLAPNPFSKEGKFKQQLKLREGYVEITAAGPDNLSVQVRVWVEVFRPVIHVEFDCSTPVSMTAAYEGWRTEERELPDDGKNSRFGCFGYDAYPGRVYTYPDTYEHGDNYVLWYHRNDNDKLIFDLAVKQQELESVKDKMWNPLKDLTFGGLMTGKDLVSDGASEGKYVITKYKAWKLRSSRPSKSHELKVYLHTARAPSVGEWKEQIRELANAERRTGEEALQKNLAWWNKFWQRSHIFLNAERPHENDKVWQIGRNYQLFRYMLGCNAYGEYPTKFNGGLFTYDPSLVEDRRQHSPDWRAWGGGSFTAQNQRLLYWPMLKSGDFDMMRSQFDFYRRALDNATLRVTQYGGHEGCCFAEQLANYGLPIPSHYGWSDPNSRRYRPPDTERGVQVNRAVNYHYEAQLEFSFMILSYFQFTGRDISQYIPFIERSVRFFDEHYQYRCRQLTGKPLDENGHLVIYPSTSCESYKGAKNPSDLIAGLRACINMLLDLPDRYVPESKKQYWKDMLERIPPFPIKEVDGRRIIQPAESWHHYQNCEIPQFYPVFPFGLYGIGKPDLQMFIDTWRYGDWVPMAKSHISWHQNGIFFARMGLTKEAAEYNLKKLENSGRRFPVFWGPGHDWVPDHNWGGSGMIGLQEMLMQTDGRKIYLFPAWPKDWDADFKLHAPYNTTVRCLVRSGKIDSLKVMPQCRRDDVQVLNGFTLAEAQESK